MEETNRMQACTTSLGSVGIEDQYSIRAIFGKCSFRDRQKLLPLLLLVEIEVEGFRESMSPNSCIAISISNYVDVITLCH